MRFVVTAGPTREHLDPVRFLSNPSSGRMGFAVARAAAAAGCKVSLVAGPVSLATPEGVERVDVTSAREMMAAVESELEAARGEMCVLVMSAAVADWRPKTSSPVKLKKGEMSAVLELERNPDILAAVNSKVKAGELDGSRLVRVGFAAETGDPEGEARRKCAAKGLDMIVANDVSMPGCGFGVGTNKATLFFPDGGRADLEMMTKEELAGEIVARAIALAGRRSCDV